MSEPRVQRALKRYADNVRPALERLAGFGALHAQNRAPTPTA